MAINIEFGAKDIADDIREEHDQFVAEMDDRRERTVKLSEGASEEVVSSLVGTAAVSREERQTGPSQVELSEREKQQLDFSRTSIFEARRAKGAIMQEGGDPRSRFDPTLNPEENREMIERARMQAQQTGLRGPGAEDRRPRGQSLTEKIAQSERMASASETRFAEKGVQRGSEEAEAFLRERGYSNREIRELRSRGEVEAVAQMEATTPVSFGSAGDITPNEWAKVKRSHEHRRIGAQNADEGRSAEITTDPSRWRQNWNTLDFPGVDTPGGVGKWLSGDERAQFTELTDDLWKWQGGE